MDLDMRLAEETTVLVENYTVRAASFSCEALFSLAPTTERRA